MIKKYQYGGPGYFLPKNNLQQKFKDKLYNLSRRIMATANNVKDINYDTLPSGEPLEGVAQTTYLLPRHLQKEKFLEYGYKESPGDYGLVKKAVGNRKLPVYQKNPDVISRNELQVVGNPNYTVWFGNSTEALTHAGNYPSAIYHDDQGNLYQKSWDLNDYGGGAGAYTHYSPKEKIMADIGDIIGSPVVVTTGFRPIYTQKGPEDKQANLLDTGEWKPLDNIINSYLNKKGLHIDSYKENGNNIKFLSLPEVIIKGKKQNIKTRGPIKTANARKWKHQTGGTLVETLGGGNTITAKQKAKSNLTKRKAPDWDNLDRGYRYLTQDMKLPHDQAIAIMGNVVEESQGDYKTTQKNGRGRGLIQWDGRPAPKGRYGQWGSIWASVAKKANVYDPDTDTVKNYWAPWNGLKGDQVRQKFISAPLKQKARIYAESYLRPGKPRIADRQLSAMQLDSIYNPKIKNIVVQQKIGGKIDFLSLGGIASGIKNIVNNVGNFMKSDTGKSILSAGSSLLGLGKSISNSGKITDAANEAEEAINAQESADRQKSFAEKYASILQEKLSKPDIDVNGSPIHTNGVNVTNEAYNQAINTFNFDNSKYNQMRKQIKEQAQQVQNENSSSMIGSVGGLIDSIGGIAGSLLNKKSTAPKGSQIITGSPDSSKQVITTNSGMSGTVDDWRKAILG